LTFSSTRRVEKTRRVCDKKAVFLKGVHSVSANTHSPYPSQTPPKSAVGTTDIVTLDFNPGYKLDFNPGTKKSVVVGEV